MSFCQYASVCLALSLLTSTVTVFFPSYENGWTPACSSTGITWISGSGAKLVMYEPVLDLTAAASVAYSSHVVGKAEIPAFARMSSRYSVPTGPQSCGIAKICCPLTI